MWWHLSMRTGPLRRDTSKQRSSVLISLSAVYENTWATVKEINKGRDYSSSRIGEMEITEAFLFTWFPPMPWQLKKPTFSFSFLPMLSTHWLVSTFLIWREKRQHFNQFQKLTLWIHKTLMLTWGEASLKSLANKCFSDCRKSKWSSKDIRHPMTIKRGIKIGG